MEWEEEAVDAASTGLGALRRIAAVGGRAPTATLELFAKYAEPGGVLTLDGFLDAAEAARAESSLLPLRPEEEAYLASLFDVFEEGDGRADFVDLMAALVSVGGGSRSAKIDAVLACYDPEALGAVSADNLLAYFSALFSLLAAVQPELLSAVVADTSSLEDADEESWTMLARAVAAAAMKACAAAGDTAVDRGAFREWYLTHFDVVGEASRLAHAPSHTGPPQPAPIAAPVSGSAAAAAAAAATTAAAAAADSDDDGVGDLSWCNRAEAARLLRLSSTPVSSLLQLFALVADEEGAVTRDAFDAVFARLTRDAELAAQEAGVDLNRADGSALDRKRARFLRATLFDAFDANGDGVVDARELLAGLTVLAEGSREDRVRAAFAALDVDDDGAYFGAGHLS